MSIFGYIAIVLFLLFFIGMIWQIHSDLKATSRAISSGYYFANLTHSAQVFESTGVDLVSGVDNLNDDHNSIEQKKTKQLNSTSGFEFDM